MAPRAASIVLAVVLAAPAAAQRLPEHGPVWTPPTPNVLILVLDDVGVESIGAYGHAAADAPPTPSLDALARRGVTFTSAWAQPLCSPARAALQTGRYALRTGIGTGPVSVSWAPDVSPPLPLSEIVLPEMLERGGAGYAHAAIGKWHLGTASVGGPNAPNLAGWGHYEGVLDNVLPPDTYQDYMRVTNGVPQLTSGYMTTRDVDAALAWIERAQGPWLVHLAFHAAHEPFHAPPPHLHTRDLASAGPPELDPRPYHLAMIEALDTEIGRLLASLDPATLRETVVILVGDNGTPNDVLAASTTPGHGKGTHFESGVRVPLIVAGPPVARPGAVCDALVSIVDVFATVADVANVDLGDPDVIPPGTELDSVSLLPYLAEPGRPSLRSVLFAEHFYPNGSGVPAGGQFVTAESGDPLVCQKNIGFGDPSPQRPVLTVCGDTFTSGNVVEVRVQTFVPSSPGLLGVSFASAPVPLAGGILAAYPLAKLEPIHTNAWGTYASLVQIPHPIHEPTLDVFVQALVLDATHPSGFRLSNAVRARYLSMDQKIVRGERYKYAGIGNGGAEFLYDLLLDPAESHNLLAPAGTAGLDPAQLEAYWLLRGELASLIHSEL